MLDGAAYRNKKHTALTRVLKSAPFSKSPYDRAYALRLLGVKVWEVLRFLRVKVRFIGHVSPYNRSIRRVREGSLHKIRRKRVFCKEAHSFGMQNGRLNYRLSICRTCQIIKEKDNV